MSQDQTAEEDPVKQLMRVNFTLEKLEARYRAEHGMVSDVVFNLEEARKYLRIALGSLLIEVQKVRMY